MVELFIIDPRNIAPSSGVIRIHNFTGRHDQPLVFQGETYTPFPVESSGWDVASNGQLPRPRVRVANLDGALQAALQEFDDLVGAVVIRKRTFEHYLDGEPTADQAAEFPEDVYLIESKISETPAVIEWELATRADVEGAFIPARQVTANSCQFVYGGSGCRWIPSDHPDLWFDLNDNRVFLVSQDTCGKRFTSCNSRFGKVGSLRIPMGAFVGSSRIGR